MTLAEILASLFPDGHHIRIQDGLIHGYGPGPNGQAIHVLGLSEGKALGIEDCALLAAHVLDIAQRDDDTPILLLVDSDSQRMSRRDELLGLNEYLAHLAKSLILADLSHHRTIGLLYGHTAAGAFIATALAAGTLVALPGAHPEVMDLPSMARVTKLSLDKLTEKAKATPVFAPGLDNLAQTGAVQAIWDPALSFAAQMAELLAIPAGEDRRDQLGAERRGRPMAAEIAAAVERLALADG